MDLFDPEEMAPILGGGKKTIPVNRGKRGGKSARWKDGKITLEATAGLIGPPRTKDKEYQEGGVTEAASTETRGKGRGNDHAGCVLAKSLKCAKVKKRAEERKYRVTP